ncbi:hypothetical protein DRO54_01940 [Candidatus Bathyarchaeota archaeon]|nr:MAG: hypothetical protein DRO54_01940 [Candidatus Bathyarchaeota archaeon]
MKYRQKILPFAVEEPEGNQVEKDLELALTICLAEEKRKKKSGILGGAPEKVVFLSKIYYPFWVVPSDNVSLILDGLGQKVFTVNYMAIPDVDGFIDQINGCEGNIDFYVAVLKANLNTFEEFMAEMKFSFDAVIGEKELLSALLSYIRGKEEESKAKTAILPLAINDSDAEEIARDFFDHEKITEKELEKLEAAAKKLREETEKIERSINEKIIQLQGAFEREIFELKLNVDEEEKKLLSEKEEKMNRIKSFTQREIEILLDKSEKLQKEIHKLELQKKEYERRRDKSLKEGSVEHSKRWELLALEAENKISECKGKIRLYSQTREKLSSQMKESAERIEKEYEEKINESKKRISNLETVYKSKIEAEKKKIEELRALTENILTQIEWLIDQKRIYLSKIKEVMLPLKFESLTLVCIPFYLACYEAENKLRYQVFPPILLAPYTGVVKKVQTTILKRGLESRIGTISKERSPALTSLFLSIGERLKIDKNFEIQVAQRAEEVNVLKSRDFRKLLISGLRKLDERGILKPEEKKSIAEFYLGH